MADRRGWGVPVGGVDHRHHVVGRKHLQRRGPCGLRQRVGVAADEQRAGGPLRGAVLDDRLRGGQDVGLVERRVEAGTPMPGRSEGDLLIDVVGVGHHRVIGGDHVGHVDEVVWLRQLSGAGIGRHGIDSARSPMLVSGGRPGVSKREDRRLPRVLALVALGGVLGALTRALIEAAWPHSPDTIGWATLIINVTGCFLIGALLGAIGRYRPEQELIRPFLGVGVLGGYTTFSTHIVEVQQLIERGKVELGLGYLFLQLGTGVIAVAAGAWLVDRRAER